MTKYVIDAYAWIEYLEGSEKGRNAAKIIDDYSNDLFTSSATIAEVISKFLRENKEVKIAITSINSLSMTINLTQEISSFAGKIHFETKKKNKNFGMLDSFVAATANKLGAKILTGDDNFKSFKEAVFI